MEYYEKSRDRLPIKSQILVLFLLEFQISTAGPINNLYNAKKKRKNYNNKICYAHMRLFLVD